MNGDYRLKRRVLVQPLTFKNPFITAERKRLPVNTYYNPIVKEGYTSTDAAQKDAMVRRIAQLRNAGMISAEEASKYMNDAAFTSEGVTSVENRDRALDAQRAIERFNAGIYNDKQRMLQQVYKLQKERDAKLRKLKAIKYLATSDEVDTVPPEFDEEVGKWYRAGIPASYLELDEEGRLKVKHDHRHLVSDEQVNTLATRQAKRLEVLEARRKRKEQQMREAEEEQLRLMQEIHGMQGEDEPKATIFNNVPRRDEGSGAGWKASPILAMPYFHSRPLISKTAEQSVDEDMDMLDEYRKEYEELQRENRGKAPPKDMVTRAFPTLARPISIGKIGDFGRRKSITKLPFIFKDRRFILTSI